MKFPSIYRGRRADRKGETASVSPADIRIQMILDCRRTDMTAYGVSSAFAAIGGLLAVSCVAAAFSGGDLVVNSLFGSTGAIAAFFFGRAAIRLRREILVKMFVSMGNEATLRKRETNLRRRCMAMYHRLADLTSERGAGEARDGECWGQNDAPSLATIIPINRKPH